MKIRMLLHILGALCVSALSTSAASDCEPLNGITPYCGFSFPEDIVRVPGSPFLIVSQMGGKMGGKMGGNFRRDPGTLVSFNRATEEKQILFPIDGKPAPSAPLWGDKDCKMPPAFFSPHGIDLVQRHDGNMMLLAVNHAERDSVQFFSVQHSRGNISLQWRGCVAMPEGSSLNDLAATQRGGFVVGPLKVIGKLQENTLKVTRPQIVTWDKENGLNTLLEFESTGYINGILISPDGSTIFANDYANNKVLKISVAERKVVAEVEVKTPDNSSWAEDGRLLVASLSMPHQGVPECDSNEGRPWQCKVPFKVIAINPDTLEAHTIFSHDGSPPFAGATVAVQVEDFLYFGQVRGPSGDRIAKTKMSLNRE